MADVTSCEKVRHSREMSAAHFPDERLVIFKIFRTFGRTKLFKRQLTFR